MAVVPHFVATPFGQLRVWEAGQGPLVLVLPGLIRAASVVAAEFLRRAPDLCARVIELPGIGGSGGVAVADAGAALRAAVAAMRAQGAPVVAFDLARGFAAGLGDPVILVQGDVAWPAPPDLAPLADGRHLTALFAHLRNAHLLDGSGRRAAREGPALPDPAALDATLVAAAEHPTAFAALWRDGLAARAPAGTQVAEDFDAAIALARRAAKQPASPLAASGAGAVNSPVWRAYADTPRGRMHVRRAGQTGRPLIALPSAPGSAAPLNLVTTGLAEGRRVVAVDYLGNGSSAKPEGAVDIARLASDVLGLADALGFDDFDLWGTHTGALIALEATIAEPTRVGRLVLEAPPLLPPEFNADILANYFPPLLPDRWGLHLQQAWNLRRDMFLFWPWYRQERAAARPLDLPDPDFLHDWTIGLLQSGRTWDCSYRAAFEYDTPSRLALLRRPALVCAGASDMLADGLAQAAAIAPEYVAIATTPATVWYPHQDARAVAATLACYDGFLRDA